MSNEPKSMPARLVSQLLEEDADLRDVVEEFVSGLDRRVVDFRTAYAAHQWDNLMRLAHQLKGAGGSYGYPELSQLGAQMESRFRAHDAADFEHWIQQLAALTQAAKAGLSQV